MCVDSLFIAENSLAVAYTATNAAFATSNVEEVCYFIVAILMHEYY